MFYALLVIPHLIAMAVLFGIAYYTKAASGTEEFFAGPDGIDGSTPPPEPVDPVPSGGGLPLPSSGAPWRRLRVGERLAELYPRRLRRGCPERPPLPAHRVPDPRRDPN